MLDRLLLLDCGFRCFSARIGPSSSTEPALAVTHRSIAAAAQPRSHAQVLRMLSPAAAVAGLRSRAAALLLRVKLIQRNVPAVCSSPDRH
jgi:hypothetical protein